MTGVVLLAVGLLAGAWLGARRGVLDHPTGPGPAVSIVIPARDEESTLPVLLTSLRALDPAPLEVLVVDDGSTDSTVAVAARGGATVITAPPRPPGWQGKPWACHLGAGAAVGTHLLFLDADTWLAPDALARVTATYRGGLLSVQPHHRPGAAYEQLSLFPNLVSALATGVSAVRLRFRGAFGPCLFTSAEAYHGVGGHVAVAGEVVEDLALAEVYRRAGQPVAGRLGAGAVGYRMYPGGLRQLVDGWSKNLAGGATRVGAAGSLGATAFVAALTAVAARPSPLVYIVAVVEIAWLSRRVGAFSWWAIVLWPLPLLAFVLLFLRSAVHAALRRPVTWRGREVPTR